MFIIYAKIRKEKGKGASRRLRVAEKLPAIVYGGKIAPVPIELEHDKIWNLQNKEAFYNQTLILVIDNKEESVKVKDIQRHAYKSKIIHIDFIRI